MSYRADLMGLILSFCVGWMTSVHASEKPNVVFILTDNQGAWSLGCYGNKDIRTPHLDRLANEGVLFENAFASNPVCSPSRATFLTGLVPSQHGVHCHLSGNDLQLGPQARNTLDELTSLPEILNREGYACGLIGKWHLGGNLHPQEGFDDYWITMPHGGTLSFYNAEIVENGAVRREPQYLTDFWTDHAVKFINTQAKQDKPFFLYLAYNGPYGLGRQLLEEGKNRHAEYYADKELLSFPRLPTHPWQFNNRDYHNNLTSLRRVATEVSGIDDGVGRIMETLKQHDIDDKTLVIFAADQGWAGGHGGFFGMGDHTRPITARDEMMRIPYLWRHPGKIRSYTRSSQLTSNYDFVPTILGYLGLSHRAPVAPKLPGNDYSRELHIENRAALAQADSQSDSQPNQADTDAVFYEFEGLRCIRTKAWKYIHRHANGPDELYDLSKDPDEFDNLISSEAHADVLSVLKSKLEAFYDQYAEPKYDMYRGGSSQSHILVGVDPSLPQKAHVEPPPLTAGFEPAKLSVPVGFRVELVAGPPLVHHPMFATFDDDGNLYVCENAGVNMTDKELEANLPNSIRRLQDTDGDGRFDTSTVFADKMTLPSGGAWHNGSLYVASPPNIWRLTDTDQDGVVDRREIVVGRFGFNGNGCDVHGCFNGPDGRIYWCDGYHGHRITDAQGNVISERKGSYLFSSRTDGSDVQLYCGGGMDNPVEIDFTDEGEVLGTVNIFYNRPRVDCFMHWQYGGAYPHRPQILDEIKVTGELLPPTYRLGHVAVAGTLRYRSGAFDYRWQNQFFAAEFNTGKVIRLETQPAGSTFSVEQREFLTSSNRDFHPTDIVEDADGSLLVLDTGGWYYRGCPTSQHAKPDILGGIYRVRRDGMTSLVDPRGLRIAWPDLAARDLINYLRDTRPIVRDKAISECARRGESLVSQLSVAPAAIDLVQRRNVVWLLTRLVGDVKLAKSESIKKARSMILAALSDPEPSIRLTLNGAARKR
jgi:putative membrane-bound dehydrogenase-like protein